jgi:hypothetical protein
MPTMEETMAEYLTSQDAWIEAILARMERDAISFEEAARRVILWTLPGYAGPSGSSTPSPAMQAMIEGKTRSDRRRMRKHQERYGAKRASD